MARTLGSRATLSRIVFFSLIAAALATILGGYRFGQSHFIDFHPIVLALMDPEYLPGDFFVSAARDFGPRQNFAWIFATLAPGPDSLPVIYFLATFLLNVAVAILMGLLARDMFRSNLAGMFAVGAAMSASFFRLAGADRLLSSQINANRLAFPLAIAGIWLAVRRRPALVGLVTGVATLLHPVFGLEVGVLLLVSMAVSALITSKSSRDRIARLRGVAGGAGVLALVSLPIMILYLDSPRIPDGTLIEVMLLRLSHELLATEQGLRWVHFALFLLGAALAWVWTRSGSEQTDEGRVVFVVFAVSILVAIAGGIVFTELIPTRFGVIASTLHRLPFVLGWLGLLAIAGSAAQLNREPTTAWGVFLYATVISPISVGLGHLLFWVRRRLGRETDPESSSRRVTWVVLACLSLFVGAALTAAARYLVLFVVVAAAGTWILVVSNRVMARVVPAALTIVLAVTLIALQEIGRGPQIVNAIGPAILPAHLDSPEVDIARQASEVTPADSIFVTPPGFGSFRFLADRAIVADFTAFPYQETAIPEWRSRMLAQYGQPTTGGAAAQREFDASYRKITDAHLMSLCESYAATHAVLYAETDSDLTVLAANEAYSLVVVDGCLPG